MRTRKTSCNMQLASAPEALTLDTGPKPGERRWAKCPNHFEPNSLLTADHMYVIAYFPGHKQYVPIRGFESLGTLENMLENDTGALPVVSDLGVYDDRGDARTDDDARAC